MRFKDLRITRSITYSGFLLGNVGIKHVWKFWPFFQKRLYALCLFARSLCFSNITTNVFYFHIFQQTHILYDTRSRIRPVISCPFRVKKKRIHFLKKKKKEKRVQNHNIPRDISKFVGKKRKISQTYHYSLLFFIINPIYKKEIASNSRSNLFRVKKERQREREFPLQSLSESRSIKEYSVLNRYPEDKLEKILS